MSKNKKIVFKAAQGLDKSYLKQKPVRAEFDKFKTALARMLGQLNADESEEHNKNWISDFLKAAYYEPDYSINTQGKTDLVIHLGDTKSPAGVLIEAKSLVNKSQMPTVSNINTRALQELVLYFLRQRITHKNLSIKHLVITDGLKWFVFDGATFDRVFAANKTLVGQFQSFEAGQLSITKTEGFYKDIAQLHIANHIEELLYVYFDLSDYKTALTETEEEDKLIEIYKILSPRHLLKLPYVADSNSLDKGFYSELLHIIGLTEVKEGGKKLIKRPEKAGRRRGSLLEAAIEQLESMDKLSYMKNPMEYGETKEERLFGVGLELCITWINRILFSKLLEAQLLSYHKGDKRYAFLNGEKVGSFSALQSLFFQALAVNASERKSNVQGLFEFVPYLNSSLFEVSELEQETFSIGTLSSDIALAYQAGTTLRDGQGKKRTGESPTLAYLFDFLGAYDFGSENGNSEVQEESKTLINASVLGLIFEKINGYKDGSFFTPGFITMYMCRETIRRAVVQKFNEARGWACETLDDVYNKLNTKDIAAANEIVNSVTVCDPAVGSGHFLVSALNEIIAIKQELGILVDADGKRFRDYTVEVANDELVILDEDGRLFRYNPNSPESQRVQRTLFHEKQTIIENCLFGVDINPNSVKICRLRLWIELLKSAYYKTPNELETLPNIDINIKTGNSLVSRFALDADLSQALKKSKWNIETYRIAIDTYRNARNKEEKREMERLINTIKSDIRTEIARTSKDQRELDKLGEALYKKYLSQQLFGQELSKEQGKDKAQLETKIEALTTKIEEAKANRIYRNAFEWRFEFPEVLDDEGNFVGFDVVVGNPPYIRQEEISWMKNYLKEKFKTYSGTADIYVFFVELAFNIMKQDANFSYILPNKWMRAGYGTALRKWTDAHTICEIIDFGDLPVFEEATTYPCIWTMQKTAPNSKIFKAIEVKTLDFEEGNLSAYINKNAFEVNKSLLSESGWTLVGDSVQALLDKIKKAGQTLGEYVDGQIYYGIKTGYNEAFVINESTKAQLIAADANSAEIIKPFLAGRDIKRYQQPKSDKYLVLFENGSTSSLFGKLSEAEAWEKLSKKYPAVADYLAPHKAAAEKRYDKGEYWWELRACAYYKEFEKTKIIIPAIVKSANYAYSRDIVYSNDKTTIIPTVDVYLLALLNSAVVDFYLQKIASTKQNGYFEYKPTYIAQLPIHIATTAQSAPIIELVDKIIAAKKENPAANTSSLEQQIDTLVYALYGLTAEEIAIVEGK